MDQDTKKALITRIKNILNSYEFGKEEMEKQTEILLKEIENGVVAPF